MPGAAILISDKLHGIAIIDAESHDLNRRQDGG
jgi:hypothetical protein